MNPDHASLGAEPDVRNDAGSRPIAWASRVGALLMLTGVSLAVAGVLLPWHQPTAQSPETTNGIQEALVYVRLQHPYGGRLLIGFLIVAASSFMVIDGALRAWAGRTGGRPLFGAIVGFLITMAGLAYETAVSRPAQQPLGPQLYSVSFTVVLVGAIIIHEQRGDGMCGAPDR